MIGFKKIYQTKTNSGELNFIGIIIQYFDFLYSKTNDDTKKKYISAYERNLFPLIDPNVAFEDLDESYFYDLIDRIDKTESYEDNTVKLYNNIVINPAECYYEDPGNNAISPFIASANSFEKNNNDLKAAYLKIPKSLSIEEQKRATEYLLSNPETEDGYILGLILCMFFGIRLNESAGASYRHINKMFIDYFEYYYINIIETVKINSSVTKMGGKSINSIRRLLMIDDIYDFFQKRKSYLERQIDFPTTGSNGEIINCVDDLPICCVGREYSKRCSANYLSLKGKEFLINIVKVEDNNVSGVASMINNNKNLYIEYKDPTTYILRRNWLTNLYLMGFSEEQIEYWAGHSMDDSNMTRGMFASQNNLKKMYQKVNQYPINNKRKIKHIKGNSISVVNEIDTNYIELDVEDDSLTVVIKENQMGDPVVISGIEADEIKDVVVFDTRQKKNICIFDYLIDESLKKE